MRIARISVSTHTNELGGRVWNPLLRWVRKHAVFVEVETGDGLAGLGECWCFDAAPDALVAFLRTEVSPHFLGRTIEEAAEVGAARRAFATLSARHGILASALSGIDIALHDLAAKARGEPLWRNVCPDGPGDAFLYASGGLYGEGKTVADVAAEMRAFAGRGFAMVKMKVGGTDGATDAARVRAVLDALPPEARLILDGVYTFTADKALRLLDGLPAERIEAFQSPVPAADIAGMARLVAEGVPVMAVEAEVREEIHCALLDRRAVRFLQVAPVACGGLSRIRELSALVRGTGIALSLEVSSTAVALGAAMHAAAADGTIAHVEYHTIHRAFFDRLAFEGPGRFGARVPPPDGPGLGFALPEGRTDPAFTVTEDPCPAGPAPGPPRSRPSKPEPGERA